MQPLKWAIKFRTIPVINFKLEYGKRRYKDEETKDYEKREIELLKKGYGIIYEIIEKHQNSINHSLLNGSS